MRIRNIDEYIQMLCGKTVIDTQHPKLGNGTEPLFSCLAGEGKELKSLLQEVATIASNEQEQLFYEFVQNAYDAKAQDLMFFWDEEYLVVLNNGLPFYTHNYEYEKKDLIKEGQLRSFLAKGASLKISNEDTLGKYGMGSKLLYLLMTSGNSLNSIEQKLEDTIIKEKKGPYVISWANDIQLQNLLALIESDYPQKTWSFGDPRDEENNLLYIKVSHLYYPIMPGKECDDLFPEKESLKVICAFEKLVSPKRFLNRLHQGTALVIPLGEGYAERIDNPNNLKNVKDSLAGFLSVVDMMQSQEKRPLSTIRINDFEIHKEEAKLLTVQTDICDKPFYLSFNKDFARANFVNFYKGLPITQTKYFLGFVINSDAFEVTNSRQSLTNINTLQRILNLVFKQVVKQLRELKESDIESFDYYYDALLQSHPNKLNDKDENNFIKEAYKEAFQPFFKDFIRTVNGDYVSWKLAFTSSLLEDAVPIELFTSIEGAKWVDKGVKKLLLDYQGFKIQNLELKDLFEEEKSFEGIRNCLINLSTPLYNDFWSNIEKEEISISDTYPDVPIYRTNKGGVYSYQELMNPNNLIFPATKTFPLTIYSIDPKLEHTMKLVEIDENGDVDLMIKRLEKHAELMTSDSIHREVSAKILNLIGANRAKDIKLFKNQFGDRVSSNDILFKYQDKDKTIVFDGLRLSGSKPDSLSDSFFMSSRSELWDWLCCEDHFDYLINKAEWEDMAHSNLAELTTLYKEVTKGKSIVDKKLCNHLFLDAEGCPIREAYKYIHDYRECFKEKEYTQLVHAFPNHPFLPWDYQELVKAPFDLEVYEISDFIGDEPLQLDTIALLMHFRANQLCSKFVISKLEQGKGYRIEKKNYKILYWLEDANEKLVDLLVKKGFYPIPKEIIEIYSKFAKEGQFCCSMTFLENLKLYKQEQELLRLINNLNELNDFLLIWSVVAESSYKEVIREFYNLLPLINIDRQITNDDTIWKIIIAAAADESCISYIHQKLTYSGNRLPDEMIDESIRYNSVNYDLRKLLPEVKEQNKLINKIAYLLPDAHRFKEILYQDKNSYNTREVYDFICDNFKDSLSLYQFEYVMQYCLTEELNDKFNTRASIPDVLNLVEEKKLKGFNTHWHDYITNNKNSYIAEDALLLEEEKVSIEIRKWLKDHPEGKIWFADYSQEERTLLKLRKNLLEDIPYNIKETTQFDIDNSLWRNIPRWMEENNFEIRVNSCRHKNIQAILNHKSTIENILNSKHLGLSGKIIKKDRKINPLLKFVDFKADMPYIMGKISDVMDIAPCLDNNLAFVKTIEECTPLLVSNKDNILKHLDPEKEWKIQHTIDQGIKKEEWDYPVYLKWSRDKNLSAGYEVFLTQEVLQFVFTIQSNESEIFHQSIPVDRYKVDNDRNIFISGTADYNDVLDILETHAEELFIPDVLPLVKLTSMVRKNESIELSNLKKEIDLANEFDQGKTTENGTETKSNGTGEEEIEEETKIQKVNGMLGEELFYLYLSDLIGQDNVEFSARKGIGEYDFFNKKEKVYIDVKTNLETLKDGKSALYIHKSQHLFMQKNPEAEFRIIRISLSDLNLKKSARTIQNRIEGKDDEKIRKLCRRKAEYVWKKKKEMKTYFEETIHSYSVHISENFKLEE